MPRSPPATWQVSSPVQASHAQLDVVFATHVPAQQLSPGEASMKGGKPGIGAAQAPPVPQPQLPELQFGAFAPQTLPQPPQFIASEEVSMQVLLQQAWPAAQGPPVPQPQTPMLHVSPSPHAFPIAPQFAGSKFRLAQRNVPSRWTQA